ncbi:MAG TPA: L,D-transpeptidase family protein, partial [Polyangiaceae bacterium]|nr:L,D-transpeptidase family protein [Polyangiaceae bacterium]
MSRRPPRFLSPVPFVVAASLTLFGCDWFGAGKTDPPQKLQVAQPAPAKSPPASKDALDPSTLAAAKAGETGEEAARDAGQEELAGPPSADKRPGTTSHPGPWLWVTRASAAIYKNPSPNKNEKLGYVKRGGQVPILEGKTDGPDCPRGFYQVASGGYICSHVGTTNQNDKDVKFRPNQPNTEQILPYLYVRNAHNGTPLYKSIPSREQTYKYEPYLPGAKDQAEKKKKAQEEDRKQMEKAGLSLGGAPGTDSKKPLWEREDDLHQVTLDELRSDSDDILAARMMKGFYVAVDKTFKWDGRTWYKTTKGLITPADRFWATDGSDFHGVDIDGKDIQLPVGWVVGVNKSAPSYDIDLSTNKVTPKGDKKRLEMVPLRYRYRKIGDTEYFQMADGSWIRDRFVRMTTPGKRPAEVGEAERWIDVDISEQTLVVFEGDRPIYATLISSGKESKVKDQDHGTPRGMWRVREKHLASTMDGDGTAAGDLPYSIEDVPYIMYFHKSY